MDKPYNDNITDSQRIEQERRAEERAEARFLRETYTWEAGNVCADCERVVQKLVEFFGWATCETCVEEPRKHACRQQFNLFDEAR